MQLLSLLDISDPGRLHHRRHIGRRLVRPTRPAFGSQGANTERLGVLTHRVLDGRHQCGLAALRRADHHVHPSVWLAVQRVGEVVQQPLSFGFWHMRQQSVNVGVSRVLVEVVGLPGRHERLAPLSGWQELALTEVEDAVRVADVSAVAVNL